MSSKAETILNNGQYKIERVLGRGEYGITYSAIDVRRQQIVAIKTVNPNLRHHTEFAQFQHHFKAVARRLSQCQHPNLVKVLEVFEDRGLPFMVMNYIPGQPLINSLQLGSPLPVTQAVQLIRQIASALTAIHQQGLIHCNLTPEVILRQADRSEVILTDFGVATRFTDTMNAQPYLGSRNLSGGYAALEQYLPHEPLTPATDIYSLAAILYYLLTGQPPLEAPLCLSQVTETLLSQSKPTLRQLRPDLSPTLERVILWGLELEQQHRPSCLDQWLAFLPHLEDYARVEAIDDSLSDQAKTSSDGSAGYGSETPSANLSFSDEKDHELLTNSLRLTPAPGFVSLVFLMTAVLSGCLGFFITRVYGGASFQTTVFQSEKSFDQQFPNYDPSKPIFQQPSVNSKGIIKSISDHRDRDFGDRENQQLIGNESQRQMASEEAWTEDYASEWQTESSDYQTVESQPSSVDDYYSESEITTDDSYSSNSSGYSDDRYSSEYPSSSGYAASEYPASSYSTPVTNSSDYPAPARLEEPSYSSDYPSYEAGSNYSPSSVESSEYDSPSYPSESEGYTPVEAESNLTPELPTSSFETEESEPVPASSYSPPDSETPMDYGIPSDSISVPKFETQPELPRSEAETEFRPGS
jgi:serine/threonine-protein kinase